MKNTWHLVQVHIRTMPQLHQLGLLLMLHTRNNTDGDKLITFSGIALNYGDTYIVFCGLENGQSGGITCMST